jgi:hypothetical protein
MKVEISFKDSLLKTLIQTTKTLLGIIIKNAGQEIAELDS